jgi:AcrR family transcriptional regulator
MKSPSSVVNEGKRLQILETARQRFLHYGVTKTTMRDIAGDLGIAVSNLYLYFQNKKELVEAIAHECRAEQERRLEEILADDSLGGPDKLKTLLIQKLRCSREFAKHAAHANEVTAFLITEFPNIQDEWENAFENSIREILALGQAQGAFHINDIPAAARNIRLATSIFFVPDFSAFHRPPREEDLEHLVDWITGTLTNPHHHL